MIVKCNNCHGKGQVEVGFPNIAGIYETETCEKCNGKGKYEDGLPNYAFIMKVLNFSSENDMYMDLWWRCDEKYAPITFFVNCNDEFWWATSDCESLTPDNFHELEQAFKDVEALGINVGYVWAPMLFVARVRKMRPQNAAYPSHQELWPLFDACGPEREDDKTLRHPNRRNNK